METTTANIAARLHEAACHAVPYLDEHATLRRITETQRPHPHNEWGYWLEYGGYSVGLLNDLRVESSPGVVVDCPATLWAAAPALLSALEMMVAVHCDGWATTGTVRKSEVESIARAAIADAKGDA